MAIDLYQYPTKTPFKYFVLKIRAILSAQGHNGVMLVLLEMFPTDSLPVKFSVSQGLGSILPSVTLPS